MATNSAPFAKRLEVKHETGYHYQSSAALGYSLAWLTPRNTAAQHLLEHHLTVLPKPRFQLESIDAFGNIHHYFELHKAHSELRVQSHAIVESAAAPDLALLTEAWETMCPSGSAAGIGDPAPWEFIYASELIPLHADYTDYARAVFTPGRALGEALLEFTRRIYTDFHYLPGSTHVDTPLADVWEHRSGVCQDFAHMAIAALRGIGLAAAYVSGYLLTYAREGDEKHIGADASHAWFAVWANEHGWIHLDPTNDKVVGDEHIVLAMGRDYADTPPVKGVCFGGGLHYLSVAVTVNELSAPSQDLIDPLKIELDRELENQLSNKLNNESNNEQ